MAHAGGHHRQFGSQVLVDLQGREIEVVLGRVGGRGNVHLRQQSRNLMRLHGAGEAAVLQQAKGCERRLHVGAAGAVTHHQQPGLREAPVQACEGLHQQRQAMPGFQRAQKADDDRGFIADVRMARGPQLGAVSAGGWIHAIGHHMHPSLRAGPGVQVVGHAGRDGQNGAGLREG